MPYYASIYKSRGLYSAPKRNNCLIESELTDVNVAGCIVSLTDTVKLLGVTIDRHLTFDSHVGTHILYVL